MKKKKVNPHRIPVPKGAVDSRAILEEATKEDMYRAWLLVGNAMIDLDVIPASEVPALSDAVNRYIAASGSERERAAEMRRAEAVIPSKKPCGVLDPSGIRTQAQLSSFKDKVYKLATFTALCVLYLGLEKSGRLDENQLKRIFINVDISMAEIEYGLNSYKKLEQSLGEALKTASPDIFRYEE